LKESHYVQHIGQVFDIHRSSYKYWQGKAKRALLVQAQLNREIRPYSRLVMTFQDLEAFQIRIRIMALGDRA